MTIQAETKENEIVEAVEANLSADELLMLQEMVDSGMLHGLSKTKTHPKMKQYIHSTRSGVEVIDLVQTMEMLKKAADFFGSIQEAGKKVLFVGTTPVSKAVIRDFAVKINQPFIIERWLGGTLTNFKIINGRVNHFKKLIEDKETGNLSKYTKKERLMIDRDIQKMDRVFGGIKDMTELPGAIFVVDPTTSSIVVKEARQMKVPVVAILSTNANPTLVDYPIVANDRVSKSITWVLNYLEPKLKIKE